MPGPTVQVPGISETANIGYSFKDKEMIETYRAQSNKLFCNNPRKEDGLVEVAICNPVGDLSAEDVAKKLAIILNILSTSKDKAARKDDVLNDVVSYLMYVDSKEVPGFLRRAVLTAYEI